jgi:MoxR-like ATPase
MKLQFKGTGLLAPKTIKRATGEEKIFPYIADPELIKSVNLAILLQRPLLLMGEPGGGKSRLAQAVAYELYHRENADGIVQDYTDFYQEWNIKSSSNATEGLYEYDAIQRLGDAQIKKDNLDKEQYIKMRAMGLAFEGSVEEDKRVVLLIDEVDKADIDFPNDLLNELDKGQFTIADTGKTIRAKVKPIVFITSNGEKELPDAFLRRCLFHYIQPLGKEILSDIITRRFYSDQQSHPELIEKALEQFLTIRQEIKQAALAAGKNVSTSELMDWFQALKYYHDLKMAANDLDPTEQAHLVALVGELDKLGKGKTEIPFKQILFKNWSTFVNFEQK